MLLIAAAALASLLLCVSAATDGRWSEWSDWTACSVSCGSGLESRYRACDPAPRNGGRWCQGSYRETQACESRVPCPVNGGWSSWTAWTPCSVSCGEGAMHRFRSCSDPLPQHGGLKCEGDAQDSQTCFAIKSCPRDGKWSSWSQWSACSVTCGRGGSIHRYRSCNNPPPVADGQPCKGLPHSTQPCEAEIQCPINGQWSQWTEWTECSVTCGNGEQRRWRGCDQPPPQFGGADCNRTEAGEMELRSCHGRLVHCPVNGGWSEWGDWGECNTPNCQNASVPSYSLRKRFCNSPFPTHNGSMCQGSFLQAGICLQPLNCRVDGGWSDWSSWACLSTVVRRRRKCNNPIPSNGGKSCRGSEIEFYGKDEDSYKDLCPDFVADDEDLQPSGSGSGGDQEEDEEEDEEEFLGDPRNI